MYTLPEVGLLKKSFLIIVAILMVAPSACAQDASRDLQNAVHKLNVWLRQNKNAVELRREFDLNSLETQAAKGPRADLGQLAGILQKFQGHKDLDEPIVKEVSTAIQNQINSLSRYLKQDLGEAIAMARFNYQPISKEQIESRRDQAVRDLKLLKKYYRRSLPSRDRALTFYDMQIDALTSYLEGLEFELPPDISVGKLTDQFNLVGQRIREVEQKLDQLPEIDETPQIEPKPPQPDDTRIRVEQPKNAGDSTADGDAAAPVVNQDNQEPVEQDPEKIQQRRAELIEELERLKQAQNELSGLRKGVLERDRERQRTRVEVWRTLASYNRGIVKASQDRHDYQFSAFQSAFSKFALIYFFGTDDNLQAEFNEKLDLLNNEFYKLSQSTERNAAAVVGNVIGWMDATEQVPELVRLIVSKYSLPNVKISVTRDLVNRLASQPVSDGRRVNEIILGRLIRGEAATNGSVNFDFIDDPNQARICIHLLASIVSRTHTRSGSITGFAGATGQAEACRTVCANIGGFDAGETTGSATINSEFYGVDSGLGLIQKIANKQYLRDKAESEAISAGRVKEKIVTQLNDQTTTALKDGQKRVGKALNNAESIGGFLPEMYLRTTMDRLWVIGHRVTFKLVETGRVSNLAAPINSMGSSVNADIAVQLHESCLSNYVDEYLNNRTMTNDEIAAEAERLTGKATEGLATAEDEEPWSITFADSRPIQFEFSDNRFAVTISGLRFSQGDSRIQAGLRIRIPFKISRMNGKLKLFRDGDATIDYMDPDRLSAKIVAFKSFLETKLNSDKVERSGIDLPDNLIPIDDVEQLKDNEIARELLLVELRMLDGWLYAGWNHAPSGMLLSNLTDTPAIWREFTVSPPTEVAPPTPMPDPIAPQGN